jgi:predicted GNAT superfamily acetyltransferase
MPQTAPPFGAQADNSPTGGVPEMVTAMAGRDARAAAARARVGILQPRDEAGARLIAEVGDLIWGPRGTLARNELRALMHAGDPVHLAVDLDQQQRPVVGFAVGFLGWSPVLHVHSHQVGVVPGHRRRGIGYALKLAQRETCLSHGVADMRWTFDPLVRRNAAFNLGALGARAASFHVQFYGEMEDTINGGDASDRLEAVWRLDRPLPPRKPTPSPASPPAPQAPSASPQGASPQLLVDTDGWPRLTHSELRPGAVLAVPSDYETLRRRDPARSGAWRAASREVLAAAYEAGLRVGRVTTTGYVLETADEA